MVKVYKTLNSCVEPMFQVVVCISLVWSDIDTEGLLLLQVPEVLLLSKKHADSTTCNHTGHCTPSRHSG